MVRRRKVGSVESVQRREVCAECLAQNAAIFGPGAAPVMTKQWESNERNDACSAVKVYPRRGRSEDRLADQTSDWMDIAPRFAQVPPGVAPRYWRLGVWALMHLQLNVVSEAPKPFVALAEEARRDPGVACEEATSLGVQRAIALVRRWVARRMRRHDWYQEEARMSRTLSPREVADLLGCTTRHVIRLVREGVLTAYDQAPPGRDRARWRIDLASARAEWRRRNPRAQIPQELAQDGTDGTNGTDGHSGPLRARESSSAPPLEDPRC